jgi:hypothetical protein
MKPAPVQSVAVLGSSYSHKNLVGLVVADVVVVLVFTTCFV